MVLKRGKATIPVPTGKELSTKSRRGIQVQTGENPPATYDFGELKSGKWSFKYSEIEWRLKPSKYKPKRYVTGLDKFDKITRGLPYGLTIMLGPAGSGKSLLSRAIAGQHRTLYVVADSYADAPTSSKVYVANYTSFLPNWHRALMEVFGLAKQVQAQLIIIDSITRLASRTTKAVEEADIRPAVFEIKNRAYGQIPVICTSEVRGTGAWSRPAGGEAVRHAGHLVLNFEKVRVDSPWIANRYEADVGDIIYAAFIEKDTGGLALQGHEFRVIYNEALTDPDFIPVTEKAEVKGPR